MTTRLGGPEWREQFDREMVKIDRDLRRIERVWRWLAALSIVAAIVQIATIFI